MSSHRQYAGREYAGREFLPSLFVGVGTAVPVIDNRSAAGILNAARAAAGIQDATRSVAGVQNATRAVTGRAPN